MSPPVVARAMLSIPFSLTLGCACLLSVVLGCGPSGPREVPVEGQLTYAGGAFPKEGTIYFAPEQPAAGAPNRPSSASFGTDGRFQTQLFPGKYRVNLECWEVPMSPEGHPGKSHLPAKWQSGAKSGFVIDVPADAAGPVQVSQDIPKP